MSSRRALTREQALRWRPWGESDLRYIVRQIERLGVTTFEESPDRSYVHARTPERTVMYLNPGFVEFAMGYAPDDATKGTTGGGYQLLSTHVPQSERKGGLLEGKGVCPQHPELGLLPLSGECDECS